MTIKYFIICFLAKGTTSIKLIFNIHMGELYFPSVLNNNTALLFGRIDYVLLPVVSKII